MQGRVFSILLVYLAQAMWFGLGRQASTSRLSEISREDWWLLLNSSPRRVRMGPYGWPSSVVADEFGSPGTLRTMFVFGNSTWRYGNVTSIRCIGVHGGGHVRELEQDSVGKEMILDMVVAMHSPYLLVFGNDRVRGTREQVMMQVELSGGSHSNSNDREQIGDLGRIPMETIVEVREDPPEELVESNWPVKARYEWVATDKDKAARAKAVGNIEVPNLQESLVDVHVHGGTKRKAVLPARPDKGKDMKKV
ncbi:hypothetical protein DEO72_LG1g2649 [Vigna unguiculata]|uniref:Uncharacterized protein n=1 Tax=Vigna unguiculata TaxID=3917 RepID=A0A4D6KN83_VIGUN|nr:hypothetical protein DEO72_LG1g2649 [Vigna unguiculata]